MHVDIAEEATQLMAGIIIVLIIQEVNFFFLWYRPSLRIRPLGQSSGFRECREPDSAPCALTRCSPFTWTSDPTLTSVLRTVCLLTDESPILSEVRPTCGRPGFRTQPPAARVLAGQWFLSTIGRYTCRGPPKWSWLYAAVIQASYASSSLIRLASSSSKTWVTT